MDDRIRPEHLCSPPPVADAKPGTTWKCRTCRARYTRRGASWQQTKKPRSRVWAIIRSIVDGILSIP
ncbi:hypothetical protein N1027_17190 [Herbiconiux sp. CPCC 205763]|uniref:Uncharacterized protein n=1 Tax=Herbiconiux aconitum TaxID=2970913 RepID=A0ABT2GWB3_9MICO|nr:hypothetical protein [Herbiconiux aconitum]MCS5719867.1 hypothetical protein [Herbiconiux aconitum]